ncbi:acyl-CoA dehydrogenase family protein [Paraburkholderia sp. GAS32]|uniref:acyl-CoA dehydrogenase family protein n=1 Tax=Paraburkholderia sp. GAS32 TaxID=3035129 RepID=UPI003D1C20F9
MIDILPTEGQSEFIGTVANAIAKARANTSQGVPEWSVLAELGCIGMGLDESVGGSGFPITDEALMYIELARQLVSPNVLAAALAARLAAEAGDTVLAQRIVTGVKQVAFASSLGGNVADGGLTGEFHLLTRADDALVVGISSSGCVVAEAHDFIRRDVVQSTDETVDLVRASGVASALYSTAGGDHRLWRTASLLIAAQLTGIARITLERAVDYAKIREQFGKPIGAFQAISHHCADMALRSEAASSQLYFAAIALGDDAPDADFHVAAACSYAMDAAFNNATVAIQVHGGVGFAAESGLHLFLKRAIMLRHLAGGERTQELAVLHSDRA